MTHRHRFPGAWGGDDRIRAICFGSLLVVAGMLLAGSVLLAIGATGGIVAASDGVDTSGTADEAVHHTDGFFQDTDGVLQSERTLQQPDGILKLTDGSTPVAKSERPDVDSSGPSESIWDVPLPDPTEPTVVDGTVYVGSGDTLYALDAESGDIEWAFTADERIQRAPVVHNGTVFVSTGSPSYSAGGSAIPGTIAGSSGADDRDLDSGEDHDGAVYAIDADDGDEVWTTTTSDMAASSPTVYDGLVYVQHESGTVRALSVDDGEEEWTNDDPRRWSDQVDVGPTVVDGTLYVGSDLSVLAIDASTGDTEWETEEYVGFVNSAPTVVDDTVYVQTGRLDVDAGYTPGEDHPLYQTNVVALDAATGEEQWWFDRERAALSPRSSPAVVPESGIVHVGSNSGNAYALNDFDGDEVWHADEPENDVTNPPTVADGTVYVGSEAGINDSDPRTGIYAFDADDGEKEWFHEFDGDVRGAPIVVDGVLYVSSEYGVHAIDTGGEESSVDSRAHQGAHGHHDGFTGEELDEPVVVEAAELLDEAIVEGEEFNVSATFTNLGHTEESHTATLEIEGASGMSSTFSVDAYADYDTTLGTDVDDPGRYDVSVDGHEVGTVIVLPEDDPVYLSDVELLDEAVLENETAELEATFENLGDEDEPYAANVTADGEAVDEESFTVPESSTLTLIYSVELENAGTYDLAVDGDGFGVDNESVGTLDVRANATYVVDAELERTSVLESDTPSILNVTTANVGASTDDHEVPITVDWYDGSNGETVTTAEIPPGGEIEDTLEIPPADADGFATVRIDVETPDGEYVTEDVGQVRVREEAVRFYSAYIGIAGVAPGEPFVVNLGYENVDSATKTTEVTIAHEGQKLETETLELDAHDFEAAGVQVDGFDEPGTYDIDISDDETGEEYEDTLYVGDFDLFVEEDQEIQPALDMASPGDVIAVAGGTYDEELDIDTEGVALVAFDEEEPVLDGDDGDLETAINVTADHVTVDGFEVRDYVYDSAVGGVVTISDASGFTLVNSTVDDVSGDGIYLTLAPDATIEGSTISNVSPTEIGATEFGVDTTGGDGIEIRDSTFSDIEYGEVNSNVEAAIRGSDDMVVENNTFTRTTRAVASGGNDAVIVDNTLDSNDGGISATGNAEISRNEFADTDYPISTMSGSAVEDNVIDASVMDSGWAITTNRETTIRNNTIENAHHAIRTERDSVVEANVVTDASGSGIEVWAGTGGEYEEATVVDNDVESDGASLRLEDIWDSNVSKNEFSSGVIIDGFEEHHGFPEDFSDHGYEMENNTVGGDDLVYVEGRSDTVISSNAGQVILVNMTNAHITEHEYTDAPLYVFDSTGTTITDVSTDLSGVGDIEYEDAAYGLRISGSEETFVTGFSSTGGNVGISEYWSTDTTITGADVTGAETSIEISHTAGTAVTDSNLTDLDGVAIQNRHVDVERADDLEVTNNTVEGGGVGLNVDRWNDTLVEDNTFAENERGVRLRATGSENVSVELANNSIVDNAEYGVQVLVDSSGSSAEIEQVTLVNNTIAGNGAGVTNDEFGLDPPVGLQATRNDWGSTAGPSGGEEDPVTGELADGDGDSVVGTVHFDPWTDKPAQYSVDCDELECTFDASESDYPDGEFDSFAWDFDDGETATGETVTHTFDTPGRYVVELTAEADDGTVETHREPVSVAPDELPDGCDALVVAEGELQAALEEADADDVVCHGRGTYREDGVVIDTGLTLTAVDHDDPPVFDGEDGTGTAFTINANDTTLDGLVLTNYGWGVYGENAPWGTPIDGVTIENVTVTETGTAIGTSLWGDLTVRNNALYDGDTGIWLWHSADDDAEVLVANNSIVEHEYGVHVEVDDATDADQIVLQNNSFEDNEWGVWVDSPAIDGATTATRDGTDVDADGESVTAIDNWWGAEDGPGGDVADPETGTIADGSGDNVTEAVQFEPWLEEVPLVPEVPRAPASFAVTIDDTNSPVNATETLVVDVTVANEGEEEATQTIELYDFDDEVADSETVTVSGNESTSIQLEWATTEDDDGEKNVTVESEDDAVEVAVVVEEYVPGDGTLKGIVTDESDGSPLEYATVALFDEDDEFVDSAPTSADGSYQMTVVPGTYNVEFLHDGYETKLVEDVTLAEDETTWLNASLTPDGDPDNGTIEGYVTDLETSEAIEDATVTVVDGEEFVAATETNASGFYDVSVEAGTYDVQVDAHGYYLAILEDVEVVENQVTSENVELMPDEDAGDVGTIQGRVTDDEADDPVPGATVMAFESNSGEGPAEDFDETDADGDYELTVSPGTYDLLVEADGFEPVEISEIEVDANETITENVTITPEETPDFGIVEYEVSHVAGPEPDDLPMVDTYETNLAGINLIDPSQANQQELADLGVESNTTLQIDATVYNYTPRVMIGTGEAVDWEITDVDGDYTNVTITANPASAQFLNETPPSFEEWPEGDDDQAGIEFEQKIGLAFDDMGYENVTAAEREQVQNTTLLTDAQMFSHPTYVEGDENVSGFLSITIGGPNQTVDGEPNDGFFDAFLTDAQLDAWNVSDPTEELAVGAMGAEPEGLNITEVDGGVKVSFPVGYSAGDVVVSPETTASGSVWFDDPVVEGDDEVAVNVAFSDTEDDDAYVVLQDVDTGEELANATAESDGTVTLSIDGEAVAAGDDMVVLLYETEAEENELDYDLTTVQDADAAAEFVVEIDGTNSPVAVGEDLVVDATVTNDGNLTDTQAVELDVDGIGVVDSVLVEDLESEASESVELKWDTSGVDADTYEVGVTSEDDVDTVAASLEAVPWGEIEFAETVIEGDDEAAINVSFDSTAGENASVVLENVDTGEELANATVDASGTVTLPIDGEFEAGEQLVVLLFESDAEENELDYDLTTVTEPATFELEIVETNAPVEEGDDLVVDVTVTNAGDLADTQVIELDVDGIGVVDSVQVDDLGGGENVTVELRWDTTDVDADTYEIGVTSEDDVDAVTITVEEADDDDDDDGGFTPPPPPPADDPAEFVVTDFVIEDDDLSAGQTVTATITVENVGDETGDHEVTLEVDGAVVATETVTLDGGESTTVTLEYLIEDDGTFELRVDGTDEDGESLETITVEAAPDDEDEGDEADDEADDEDDDADDADDDESDEMDDETDDTDDDTGEADDVDEEADDDTDDVDDADDETPGFGVLAAAMAVLAVLTLIGRRLSL